jgi:hypothetical protein
MCIENRPLKSSELPGVRIVIGCRSLPRRRGKSAPVIVKDEPPSTAAAPGYCGFILARIGLKPIPAFWADKVTDLLIPFDWRAVHPVII